MKAERLKHELRLRLLAFVLALALTWYALNPAPGPVRRGARRDDEPPEGERREAKPSEGGATLALGIGAHSATAQTLKESGPDELDWPEFIETD